MDDQQKASYVTLEGFLMVLFLQLLGVLIFIYAWKRIWLDTQKLSIPKHQMHQQMQPEFVELDSDSQKRVRLKTLKQTLLLLRQIIADFSHDYIYSDLGFQAFTYLAFQRRIIKILIILCMFDFCIWVPYLLLFQELQSFSLIAMSIEKNQNFRTTYTIMLTSFILYFLITFKRLLRYRLRLNMVKQPQYELQSKQFQQEIDYSILNIMKLRTINIKILKTINQQSQIQSSEQIRNYFQRFLNVECATNYKIYEIISIPDYGQVLNFKYKSQNQKIKLNIVKEDLQTPILFKCISNNTQQNLQKNIKTLQRCKQNQIDQKRNCFISAFIVVDKFQAVKLICQHFKLTNDFCRNQQNQYQHGKSKYLAHLAQSPKDIIWINLKYHKSSIFRKIIFNIICIFILIFISTPSTVLNFLKIPPILSTFLVLITNSLLSFILSKFVQQQKDLWQSKKQQNQFNILIFYLGINIILVPIARGVNNLSQFILNNHGWGWLVIFDLVYKKIDGYYYCILFLNQTLACYWNALVKPVALLQNYGSPTMFIKTLKLIQDISYGTNDNFQFGYSYALMVVIFTLSIIFSTSIPLIHVFCLIFYLVKYYLDTYTLLTFHKEQTNSLGIIISKVLFAIACGLAIQLFLVANSLLVQKQFIHSIILYFSCFMTGYFAYQLKKPLFEQIDLIIDEEMNFKVYNRHLNNWKSIYSHPVLRNLNLN